MSWHASTYVNNCIHEFHSHAAMHNDEQLQEVEPYAQKITDLIMPDLDYQYEQSLSIYTFGSAFENSQISYPVEMDFLIAAVHEEAWASVEPVAGFPGYYTITEMVDEIPICAEQYTENFLDYLHHIRNESGFLSSNTWIQPRGTSSTWLHGKHTEESWEGGTWFILDLVPGIEIKGSDGGPSTYYIPRKLPYGGKEYLSVAWVQSDWEEEKEWFSSLHIADPRLKCLRVLKAIRDGDDGLRRLGSGLLKNVVMRHGEYGDWGSEDLGVRVLGCLNALQSAFSTGILKKRFDHGVNLLENHSDSELEKMYYILRDLVTDEDAFLERINGGMETSDYSDDTGSTHSSSS